MNLTLDGVGYLQERRQAGVDAFVTLITELPVDKADALAEAVGPLTHLQRLDEERRARHLRHHQAGPAHDHGDDNGLDSSPQHRDHPYCAPRRPVNPLIVVGIDGSDSSWDAFCWACGETSRLGGRTVAVFVGPTSGAASGTATASMTGALVPYSALQQSMADQAEKLTEQVRAYGHDHGVDVAFVHTQGDTAKELLRIANADHADLLVVGRSRKARHRLAGSLGRRLIGRRGAPIVVVVP